METKSGLGDIIVMVALILFAVILVDERWIRTAIAFVPAMLLAQRAVGVRVQQVPDVPKKPFERRLNNEVRGYIEELLKHFREFYASVHLLRKGQLSPEEASGWAAQLERELNALLADITEAARHESEVGGA